MANGTYQLKFSYIGFKDKVVTIEVKGENIALGNIVLEESIEALSEVEITHKKPTLKRESDRLIFDVENSSLSEGNMIDVLKSTPSVLVIDDALIVKNSSPTVYINDRKVHLEPSDLVELLQGTPATNIKSVEVITNPSARYDADSGGVVINIVMSKNLVTGYNGNVFTNYTQGVYPRMNYGTSHYFKNSKIDFFVNYSYTNNKINRKNHEEVKFSTQDWTTDLDRNTRSETHNVGFNLDYKTSDKSVLSLSGNLQFLPYFDYLTKGETTVEGDIEDFNYFYSNNLSRDDKNNIGLDLDYKHNLSDNSSLRFNAHYTNYDYTRNQSVFSDYYLDALYLETTAFNTNANQDTDIFTTQLDFNSNLGENSELEIGAKLSSVNTNSGIIHNDIIGGLEVLNPQNTNVFDYEENVYAGYLNYSYSKEKVSLNLGIRAEQTNVEGLSEIESNTQDYLKWFPNASINYDVSENFSTYFNYKKSIQRPNYSNLNPFVFYLNDNNVVTGNPELKPVIIDHYLLGTTLFEKFTIEAYYKSYTDYIFELPLQDNTSNIIYYTPYNIDKTTEIGIDFETYFNITEKWFLYFGSSTFNIKDQGVFNTSEVTRDKWANYSIMSNDFTFLKDKSLTANLTLVYISDNLQGFGLVDSRFISDLSFRKTILKGKGVLSLAFSDLFNQQDFTTRSKYLDQDNRLHTNLDNRTIKLGFRYKFGNTKLSTNQRSTSKEELDRLSSSN